MNFEFMTDKEIIESSKPKTYTENLIMKKLYKSLGDMATVLEVANYFKISKAKVYKSIEERKIISVKLGNKRLIVTNTLINLFKGNEDEGL